MQKCTLVVILSTLRSIGGYRQITLYQRNLMKCWLSLDDATCELSWFESHTSLFGFFLRFVVVVFIYCLCGNLQVFRHVCKVLLHTWWPYQLNRSCNPNGTLSWRIRWQKYSHSDSFYAQEYRGGTGELLGITWWDAEG